MIKDFLYNLSEQEYEWDGMGNHLTTRFYGVSYTGKQYTKMTRKYTGDGRVIDNNTEIYAQYPGGYMQDSTYCFYVKDYRGNNIAVLDSDNKLIQQTDYYPYGEPWKEPTGQPWLYSANERLRLDGINEYDFNARRFNSAEGRFSSWDLLTEKRPWESPYSFCGGDPVNFSDPTGLFSSKQEAKDWAKDNGIKTGFLRYHKIEQDNEGTWVIINRAEGYQYYRDAAYSSQEDGVVKSALCFDSKPGMISTELSYAYNSPVGRAIIPDFIQLGIGYDGIGGVGASCNWELNWVLRGPERSWKPILSMTAGPGAGFSLGAEINLQRGHYLGPSSEIRRNNIQTFLGDNDGSVSIYGGAEALGRINIGMTVSTSGQRMVIYDKVGVGIGIPAGPLPLNGAITTTNTIILK